MNYTSLTLRRGSYILTSFVVLILCALLLGCDVNISPTGGNFGSNSSGCQGNCTTGPGAQGVQVFVEPDAREQPILDAIAGAKKSVWLEIYLLSDRNVIRGLEEAANRGIDVRVMLEPHPFGGGGSPARTMDELKAAGAKVEDSNPSFALTHEKGMIVDGTTAFSGSSGSRNREYAIVDTNPTDVQAVSAIFQADWQRTTAQFNDANLVVSPINSRNDFTKLIGSAQHTLLIEAEEMNDSGIEQALSDAARHGVHVQVILPAPRGSSGGSNSQGIDTIKEGGVDVREDARLYMHAKIIIVDGQKAFVGSENISTQSLDQNRELGIIVSDQGVLHTLQQTFQQDWGDSQ